MKTFFPLSIIFLLISCSEITSNQNQMCLIGSESFELNQKNGVDYLSYKNYSVQKVPNKNEPGENFHVFDKNDILAYKSLNKYNYFYGIYKNYLFIDDGTGNIRQLIVIDLNSRKQLFSITYTGDIHLKNGMISYYHPFIGEEPPHKPDCPEAKEWGEMMTGYLEHRYIDLKNNNIINTGEISCTYME